MASLCSLAPRAHAHLAMVSSCVNPSSCGTAATNYTPFTIGKGSHSMPPLSKRSKNGSVASSTCGGGPGPSLSFHGADSGARPWSSAPDTAGIGIIDFLVGKNILITGGTGFLAKVLIEKILRVSPSVGKIYVVIKAKDTESTQKRLQNEVVDTELFKCLHEIHSKDYHGFLARKLVPVAGDVTLANLGIDPNHAHEITEDVDIIVNSAANTTFDERYDVAMDINTLGPLRLMRFARRFRKLKLFLQVSTAYVNGQRQGVVLEKPFRLGDTIANELHARDDSSQHKSGAMLDIEAEIKNAFDTRKLCKDSASFTQGMKCLGLERAKLHGWQDTYVFTKAMGEMVINCMRGDIPVVTIRPSVIESTLKDPFPGWIQGSRMMDPFVLNYGKGHLSGFIADPDCVFDMVPADMVVNAMLASMAKHGGVATPGMHVYHVGSSTSNPLLIGDLVRFISEHFQRSPVIDAAGHPVLVSPFRLFDSMENFVSYEATSNARRAPSEKRRQGNLRAKLIDQITRLCRIYQPYTFYGGRFDSANMEKLFAEMSAEERERFHFDVRSVNWMDYVANVHIPGLRKHVMKGRGSPARI